MEIQETPEGIIVKVRVKPSSPRFRLSRKQGTLILDVTNPPKEGKANQEILSQLPRLLRCEVRILSGHKTSNKLLLLKGITEGDLELVLETR
jgi:uncharacterized protein (TIGR00251 family)